MKIDLDYFRKMLDVFLEAETAHVELYDFPQSGVEYVDAQTQELNEKFIFHFQLLTENKLISNRNMDSYNLSDLGIRFGASGDCILSIIPLRLTQAGHDFALTLHNKEVIEKLKSELKDMPFKVIFEGGQKLLQHYAKKKLNALLAE
ncbi:DUF2513 domain-containing protein [Photobacterium sp. TY1-4]|uniref:DUF2513 domain-containing protein n=1 Tax=Photobacterium sp. TY1-4 TaxID=2899122 RepID=UPI0021BF710A|nr:DUF2513 domain-containing protein [Photobacterium sp. TY1-4]UXI03699.1 DUF2513 domain-containing protein [Photobacterium sp. TY1-4]